jgi:Outer membrane protein beta-barrel domain
MLKPGTVCRDDNPEALAGLARISGLVLQGYLRSEYLIMRNLIVILASLVTTQVMAGETPWYVGGGVGMTSYQQGSTVDDIQDASIEFDSMETGYQLFGGYQLNERWGIEAGYINFGETEDFDPTGQIIGIGLRFESTGFYVNSQYQIPFANIFSLDLSGGWLFGEGDATELFPPDTAGVPQKDSYSDNGFTLGAAVTWLATESFHVRGGINYFAVDYDNVIKEPWRLGVDAIWNF